MNNSTNQGGLILPVLPRTREITRLWMKTCEFDRPFAAGLHAGEKLVVDSFVAAQSFAKNIGGGDGLLNREIDAYPANRRHRMGGVPNAQKARPVPFY
jgi:hypothetical protein